MIGSIILLVLLLISFMVLFGTLIYGAIFFFKEKEYIFASVFTAGFIVIVLSVIAGLLVELGI